MHSPVIVHVPVLYLRSFADDGVAAAAVEEAPFSKAKSDEEIIVTAFSQAGPVITLGRPGEDLPQLGASRLYVNPASWRETVSDLMATATLTLLQWSTQAWSGSCAAPWNCWNPSGSCCSCRSDLTATNDSVRPSALLPLPRRRATTGKTTTAVNRPRPEHPLLRGAVVPSIVDDPARAGNHLSQRRCVRRASSARPGPVPRAGCRPCTGLVRGSHRTLRTPVLERDGVDRPCHDRRLRAPPRPRDHSTRPGSRGCVVSTSGDQPRDHGSTGAPWAAPAAPPRHRRR